MELRHGKIKNINVSKRGIKITMENEEYMSIDFLRMRHRVLKEAIDEAVLEVKRIEEIAEQAQIDLNQNEKEKIDFNTPGVGGHGTRANDDVRHK